MRSFLTICAVAGLFSALATPVSAEVKLNHAAMDKLGWKLSIQCWTFNKKTVFEVIDIARSLDVRYIEMFPGQKLAPDMDVKVGPDMPASAVEALQKKLSDSNVKVVAFGVCGVPTNEAGARKMFEWAKKMGIEVLNTETTPTAMHDKLCEEFGIRYALHNHPATWPPDKVLAATKDRNKLIGSCSDTGHWRRAKQVPIENLKKLEGKIMSLHFKDLNEKNQDVPFGTGLNDAKGMLAELKRQDFKGVFSIEYEHWDDKLLDNVGKCCQAFSDMSAELAQ